jgi:hypothetical protein
MKTSSPGPGRLRRTRMRSRLVAQSFTLLYRRVSPCCTFGSGRPSAGCNSALRGRARERGLTRTDAIMAGLVVGLLVTLLNFVLWHEHRQSAGIRCVGNLNQVGMGFRIWAADNMDSFPWNRSTNANGTAEYTNTLEIVRHFQRPRRNWALQGSSSAPKKSNADQQPTGNDCATPTSVTSWG